LAIIPAVVITVAFLARWALLFIVRAFFNDTITVAVWTGFHVRLMGMLYPSPAIISAGASLIRLLRHVRMMSALPPKADIQRAERHARFVP